MSAALTTPIKMSTPNTANTDEDAADRFRQRFLALRRAMGEIIVGGDDSVFAVLAALISGGHVLLEGPPGTGKTLMAKTVARLTGLSFSRVQFTPDLLPSDIVGGAALRRGLDGVEETVFRQGPVFANIVLADELNRASPRTQAALLEVMEERQVTTHGATHRLDEPFVVLATQNPWDQGTYPIPESQLDRFLVRVEVQSPDVDELVSILERRPEVKLADIEPVVDRAGLLELRDIAADVVVAPEMLAFIARIVRATDPGGQTAPASIRDAVRVGVSARGARSLLDCAKIRAVASGRGHLSADDVRAVSRDVLGHRLVLAYTAESAGNRSELVADAVASA